MLFFYRSIIYIIIIIMYVKLTFETGHLTGSGKLVLN